VRFAHSRVRTPARQLSALRAKNDDGRKLDADNTGDEIRTRKRMVADKPQPRPVAVERNRLDAAEAAEAAPAHNYYTGRARNPE